MTKISKREYLVIGLCVLLLLLAVLPSLQYARREYRDGLRREELAAVKRQLEDIYNKKNAYPVDFSLPVHRYFVTSREEDRANAWYIQASMENPHETSSGYDAEEGHNFYYRYMQQAGQTFYEICGGDLSCAL